jgi:RHS repeat-associated protein
MSKEVTVKEAGFAYIYISNENPTLVEFYVDDVVVTHTPTNVIQYNEYYPFGLQTSTSWTRENTKDNNYLYNAGNELNKDNGWYEMFYRGYDPATGRMLQIDPYATMYASATTYNYALNNPVMMNDPSGGLTATVGEINRFISKALKGDGGRWSDSSDGSETMPTYYRSSEQAFAAGMDYMDQYDMWGGGGGSFAANVEVAAFTYSVATGAFFENNPTQLAYLDPSEMSVGEQMAMALTSPDPDPKKSKLERTGHMLLQMFNLEADDPAIWGNKEVITTEIPPLATLLTPMGAARGTVVIGEGMGRVTEYAAKIGARTIEIPPSISNMVDGPAKWSAMMTYNRQWILQQLRNGIQIIDIGIDVNRPAQLGRSIYFQMEQNMIKYYNQLKGVLK